MKKISASLLTALALLIMAASCSKDDPAAIQVSEITLSKTALSLLHGESETLTATIAPNNAEDPSLSWKSSVPAVATVDKGLVTARAKGMAIITVTSANGKTATCAVTVEYVVPTVRIPQGRFMMGSSDGSAVGIGTPGVDVDATPAEPTRWEMGIERQHWVTLTKDYYMSQYEITNAQYAAFLNAVGVDGTGAKADIQNGEMLLEPSRQHPDFGDVDWGLHWSGNQWTPVSGYENHPVVFVSWYGAKAYALWAGGDLPTEAQWERAARGGIENRPFGLEDGWVLTGHMANINGVAAYDFNRGGQYVDPYGPSLRVTRQIGAYIPNAYGLYDMHGNVYEWCEDWYDDYSNLRGFTDPVCTEGTGRVVRSSHYDSPAAYCRSAFRGGMYPQDVHPALGLRIVFPAAQN
jgi:formylglycine-generating enzyme required for sulfatase activity